MKRLILVLLTLFFVFACASETFFFPIKSSARLKDKKTVTYDIEIFFNDDGGVKEIQKKEDKITHAIRIILGQRNEKHLKDASRLKSVLKKVFKSQLKNKVKSIKVNSFIVK